MLVAVNSKRSGGLPHSAPAKGKEGGVDGLLIRQATADDLEAVNAIYNYYVLGSTCTYQTEPETVLDRRAWFDRHGPEHPLLIG